MSTYFSGRVTRIRFHNDGDSYYVLNIVLDHTDDAVSDMFSFGTTPSHKEVTVVGNVHGMTLEEGSWLGFEAQWVSNEKHGRQLKIDKAPVIRGAWTPEIALSLLTTHGVPEAVCLRVRNHFGEDNFLTVLDNGDTTNIQKAPGITPFTADHLVDRWRFIKSYFRTLEFLTDAQVPKYKIQEVWATFGDEAKTILSDNPWALVQIDGIKFEQADEVALRLGLDMDSPLRLKGAALFAAKTRRGMGHLYLGLPEMIAEVQSLVPASSPKAVGKSLVALHKENLLVLDRATRPGTTAVYEPWSLRMEKESARLVVVRKASAIVDTHTTTIPEDPDQKVGEALHKLVVKTFTQSLSSVGAEALVAYAADAHDVKGIARAALSDWSGSTHMKLSPTQVEGALNALTEPVSILTGLPGTGKTTTLNAVVSILRDAEISFLLCAPTGIAAKKINSVTGAPASTIHRAFQAKGWDKGGERKATYAGVVGTTDLESSDGSGEEWGFTEDNPHTAQVIIVDEFSMVDQHMFYRLLSCTSEKCRLVCVGDAAQLPSVGPGNVLRDLIASKLFATVNLTEIFRQAEQSGIIKAAHATFRGSVPNVGEGFLHKKVARSTFSDLEDFDDMFEVGGYTPDSEDVEEEEEEESFQVSEGDFILVEDEDEDVVLEEILERAKELYNNRSNFQILSPRHAGTLGVTNLNQQLREIINPKQPGLQEQRLGPETIREDDRVMVVKNNYEKGIYNGDVGKVVKLDRRLGEVEIKLHGPPVLHIKLPFKDASKYLRLAYAMTVHKCVHPDTLTETSEGLLPLRDIAVRGGIATPDAPRPYRNKVDNPDGPAIRITTRGGYTLTTTPDHGVDVWDGEQYIRREVGDIREGDLLRLKLGVTSDPVAPPLLPPAPPHNVRAEVHHLPPRMDPFVAEFLGLMVADGTVYPKGFRLAKRHEDTVDRFVELCRHLFKVEAHKFFKLGAHQAEVNSTYLSAWLSSIGGLDPHAKGVPECVLRSNSGLQAKFLRGLFAEGSVNVKGGCLDHVEWTCKFDSLPNVVRTMLLRLGFPCGTTSGRGIHTLYIYGEYAQRFGEIVGFPSEAKRERLLLPCGKQTKYFVPVSKAEARLLRGHLDDLGHSTCGNVVQRGRLSLHNLNLLIDSGVDTAVVKVLQERALYHHEPVVLLEATTCPSMCVEVPEGHRFLQNGFSAWNSQGQEYDVIMMPLVKGFGLQLQRNLFYTAITRARSRVVLVGQSDALTRSVMNNREDARNTLFQDRLLLAAVGGLDPATSE